MQYKHKAKHRVEQWVRPEVPHVVYVYASRDGRVRYIGVDRLDQPHAVPDNALLRAALEDGTEELIRHVVAGEQGNAGKEGAGMFAAGLVMKYRRYGSGYGQILNKLDFSCDSSGALRAYRLTKDGMQHVPENDRAFA